MTSTSSTSTATVATTSRSLISVVAELASAEHRVRFDNECILIPEVLPQKRPRVVTKSYSLPLWRRRSSISEQETAEPVEEGSSPVEDTHVVFKVPFPSFLTRQPSRGRSTDPVEPLSPCLVHRSPSSPRPDHSPTKRHMSRSPSLPSPTLHYLRPLVTIPLRTCCHDCYPVLEESLKEGELWQEKFSRGARRRRSSSCSFDDFSMPPLGSSPPMSSQSGFAAVVSPRFKSSFSLTVDEVDKRRRSQEHSSDDRTRHPSGGSDFSLSSSADDSPLLTRGHISPKASPIEEEDEDQLFPLPSPRRSPSASPTGSIHAGSPVHSPNASTSRLVGPSSSRDSLRSISPSGSGSEEGVIPRSLARKGRCEKGLLTPDASTDRLRPASPTSATTQTSQPAASPPLPASGIQNPKPTIAMPSPSALSHRLRAAAPLEIPHTESPEPMELESTGFRESPLPSLLQQQQQEETRQRSRPTSPIAIPTAQSRSRSMSSSKSSTHSPSHSPTRRRHVHMPSFSPSTIFKAGADVLKGVSSMGGVGGYSS